ncbi:unnamed protein product, partial [Vitis vinifera]
MITMHGIHFWDDGMENKKKEESNKILGF